MRLIIERYLMREIALTFFAVSLLLMLMTFSTTFIRLLTQTLEGDRPVSLLMSLFTLQVVANMVFILPFAFFTAVLLTFSRLYKDNEIVVMHACGAGYGRILYSVGFIAVIVAVVIGFYALFIAPWAEDKTRQLLDVAGAQQGIQDIIPGRFNNLEPGGLTIYVERYNAEKKRLYGIFVQGNSQGTEERESEAFVLSAEMAYERIASDSGVRYLVLQNGYRYEGVRGQSDYRITQFSEHGIRIQNREVVSSSRPRYAVATSILWNSDHSGDLAEVHWRLAIPISTLLLALLAVPLSKGSPRSGGHKGLFFGILLYVVYNNLLTVGRSALAKGEVMPWLGLWWVHLLVLGLLVFMIWRLQRVRGPRAIGSKTS